MKTYDMPMVRSIAETAAGLMHSLAADSRFSAWWIEQQDTFGGCAGLYAYVAGTAAQLEQAADWDCCDFYLTLDAVATAIFDGTLPVASEPCRWAALLQEAI